MNIIKGSLPSGTTGPSPDIACYPVILSRGEHAHAGSLANLAGENASDDLLDTLSCDKLVSAETPPCFIWHTGEDPGVPVENSMLFASALRKADVPFELHVYQRGRHGLGLNAPFAWADDCVRWIGETTE